MECEYKNTQIQNMTGSTLLKLRFGHRRNSSLKSQVVSLQTAHSWANAGVLLGDACIGSGVAFEAI